MGNQFGIKNNEFPNSEVEKILSPNIIHKKSNENCQENGYFIVWYLENSKIKKWFFFSNSKGSCRDLFQFPKLIIGNMWKIKETY